MPPEMPHSYQVVGRSQAPGSAEILAKGERIVIDASPAMAGDAPGPAELLAPAFAACSLKNVERFAQMLPFRQTGAWIHVTATRQDSPPKFTRISYELHVRTDEPPERVDLLYRNIQRHGTVFNTLAAACEVTGEIIAEPLEEEIP